MMKLLLAFVLCLPALAVQGIEFGSIGGGQAIKMFAHQQGDTETTPPQHTDGDEEVLPLQPVAPASHPLAGTYNDHTAYSTITIDRHGRITNQFYVSVNQFSSWPARFPQRLKQNTTTGAYSTNGVIYGTWSNGITCNYPMGITVEPSEDNEILDVTIKIPANYAANCQSWGVQAHYWSMEKAN